MESFLLAITLDRDESVKFARSVKSAFQDLLKHYRCSVRFGKVNANFYQVVVLYDPDNQRSTRFALRLANRINPL